MRNDHFRPLDGLRGIAILLVILVHSFNYKGSSILGRVLDTVARAGWVGVTLFFVLSGFLITGILLDTRDRKNYLRDFFARRSLRIFPLYFAFLAIYFFVAPHVPYVSEQLPQPQPEMQIYYWTYLANMMEWLSGTTNKVRPLDPI
jgi:peptidoglycan/LPS O-acetylase OafA/YrhL